MLHALSSKETRSLFKPKDFLSLPRRCVFRSSRGDLGARRCDPYSKSNSCVKR